MGLDAAHLSRAIMDSVSNGLCVVFHANGVKYINNILLVDIFIYIDLPLLDALEKKNE